MFRSIALAYVLVGATLPVQAADFADPTWPCIQRKVENLSLGLMWALPIDPAAIPEDEDLAQEMADLSGALSLRRVSLDDLRPQVEDFAGRHGGNADILGQIFANVFEGLNKRRSRIINGIGDFSLSQISLAEQIEGARIEMSAQMDKEAPDFDKVDALEEQIDWDQVIYTDRQRSIQYLCETPVIIERRLFSIAQLLQQLVQDQG
ncbi:hypothetical protein ACOTTU_22800 [Roseobacter sp. EG26]|uniref:hypothetical protein n=1 Tax=Roseobacter sp. EG26 TaxID=3412477 RepID=UPI003CE46089